MTTPAPAEPIYDWSLETDHLDSLMDSDARCQAPECEGLATHVRVHADCHYRLCDSCTEGTRRFLGKRRGLRVNCHACGVRYIPATDITIRPI